MKTKLISLFGCMLLCAACDVTVTDSTDDTSNGGTISEDPVTPPPEEDVFHVGDVQKTRNLPTDYYIKDLMAYTWNDAAQRATVYSSTCKEVDMKLFWKADNKEEYDVTFREFYTRDSIYMSIRSKSYAMYYDANLDLPYPAGLLYQADKVKEYSIDGVVIGDGTYSNVGFINTDCPVEDLDFADEIMNFLKINENDRISYKCNTVTAAGVDIKLVSNKPTSVSYQVAFGDNRCDLTETLRFAYNEEDCNAAYEDFLIDVEDDPTLKFDMNDYSYSLNTESLACIDNLLDDFYMNAPLFKGKQVEKKTSKDFAKLLAQMSKKIRK